MSLVADKLRPKLRPPRRGLPRRTARLRLTVFYGGLFFVSGAVLLAITNVLVRRATGNSFYFRVTRNQVPSADLRVVHRELITVRSAPLPAQLQDQVSRLQALAVHQHASDLHQLLVQSATALAVMTLLSLALGWLVAGHVLRPLRAITAKARHISARNLHERLAIEGPDDEFKELGDTLDQLLARLEASFEAQRHFVANASHELRTPLTLERALLQLALADPGATTKSLRSACEEVLVSGAGQERLIEGLLTLASSERGLEERHPVDLAALARDALAASEAGATDAEVALSAEAHPAVALGDPHLAGRLVANLVENAVRHNKAGGWARVGTASVAGRAVLTVANTGPVIEPGELERLFQPFQRLAPQRSADGAGHGLGLAIVKAIAVAHDATITARARAEGGLEVKVSFPLAEGAEAGMAGPGAATGAIRATR